MTDSTDDVDWGDGSEEPQPRHPGKIELGNVDDMIYVGVPAAKFKQIGDTVKGVVFSVQVAQCRDIATSQPTFWPDGNPMRQMLVDLETEDRNEDIDDDNGHRRLYAKQPSGMLKAIVEALRPHNLKPSEMIGGTLAVKYSQNGVAKKTGFNKPKLYVAKFWPAGTTAAPSTPSALKPEGASNAESAMQGAWGKFQTLHKGETKEVMGKLWKAMFGDYFHGLPKEQITAAQWRKFAADEFRSADAPLADSEFKDDDIPF